MAIVYRRRKSEKLTPAEKIAFKKWVMSHDTQEDAREALGVAKSTLDRVLALGSGNPDTVQKIREKINPVAAA